MKFRDSKLYIIIFTFIISFFFIVILAYINSITKDKIAINTELFMIKAVLNSMSIEYSSDKDAYDKFNNSEIIKKSVLKSSINNIEYTVYKSSINNENIIAIINSSQGLWGTITAVLALNEHINKIIGIDFISQNETPGLGGRIEEKWFKDQFKGEKIDSSINMVLSGRKNGDDNHDNSSFDSITGATRTTEGVQRFVNDSINIMKNHNE